MYENYYNIPNEIVLDYDDAFVPQYWKHLKYSMIMDDGWDLNSVK